VGLVKENLLTQVNGKLTRELFILRKIKGAIQGDVESFVPPEAGFRGEGGKNDFKKGGEGRTSLLKRGKRVPPSLRISSFGPCISSRNMGVTKGGIG